MIEENLIKVYEQSFRANREMSALSDYFKKEESYSYYEIAKEIAKLHLLFKKAKLKAGDKVALIGRNNPRWCICYIATITYGAVIVPILQDFNPNDVVHIVNHSESRLLFLGDNFWDNIEPHRIKNIEGVFSLTDYHLMHERDGDTLTKYQKDITRHYRKKYPNGFTAESISYPTLPNDHVCLLNYTSGTTGSSKGVILTLNNVMGNLLTAMKYINPKTGEPYFHRGGRALSFLPLAHAYGCAFDFLTQLAVGAHVTLLGRIPSPKILMEAMQEVRPTLVNCVPLILEKIYRKQVLPMLEKGAMSIAVKIPLLNSAIYSVIKNKLFDAFGGQVELFIVGGAPLSNETEAFLQKIGFPITVGYGMTECAPLISFTSCVDFKATSCGKVIGEHLEVKIDSAEPSKIPGEIIVKGEHVMVGYYKNEEATKAVLNDGWLHTGDMGLMEEDGTLYIRGRCKTMILSASGQNIYPEQIEDKLNNMYLVSESLVIDNNGRLVALVVPDYESAEREGVSQEQLKSCMEQNLKELNSLVASYEKISTITIYPTEFEKTPKRSIKRYLYNTSLIPSLE
ncbi:MAG: AMP-binding protein [Rikenellaceae bacterium]